MTGFRRADSSGGTHHGGGARGTRPQGFRPRGACGPCGKTVECAPCTPVPIGRRELQEPRPEVRKSASPQVRKSQRGPSISRQRKCGQWGDIAVSKAIRQRGHRIPKRESSFEAHFAPGVQLTPMQGLHGWRLAKSCTSTNILTFEFFEFGSETV